MNWIEKWFGIAPDNGDGSLELLLALCCGAAAVFAVVALSPPLRRLLLRVASPSAIIRRETRS